MENSGTELRPRRDCVVLLHGTWGSESNWMKSGSPLRLAIDQRFGDSVDCREFQWSGRNRHGDRRAASEALVQWLGGADMKRYRRVHLIAHSHGGNIAVRASFLDPSSMASVLTVGTPFITISMRERPLAIDILSFLTIPLAYVAAAAWSSTILKLAFSSIDRLLGLVGLLGGDPESWLGVVVVVMVFLSLLGLPFLVGRIAAWLIADLLQRSQGRRIFLSYRGFSMAEVPTRCIFDARDEAKFAIWSTLIASSAIRKLSWTIFGACVILQLVLLTIFVTNGILSPEETRGQGVASSYLGKFEPVYHAVGIIFLIAGVCSAMMSPLFSIFSLGARSAMDLMFLQIRVRVSPFGDAVEASPVTVEGRRLRFGSIRFRHSQLCHDRQVVAIIVEWLETHVCGGRFAQSQRARFDTPD